MGQAVSLVGAVFALSCVVTAFWVIPAGAQDGGIPPGTAANGTNPDNPSDNPTIITIAAGGCTVAAGASITLQDGDGTRAVFTDGERGITIISQDGRPRIEGPQDDFIGDYARYPLRQVVRHGRRLLGRVLDGGYGLQGRRGRR